MSLFSMARITRLDLSQLSLAETHARREDERSKSRQVRDEPPITWLPAGAEGDPLALEKLYTKHVEGAFIPKGQGKALHMLVKFPQSVSVSTRNEAAVALALAVEFVQSNFGGNAVFAARMDRDEKSLTNADIFIAPRYIKTTKHSEKEAISLSRHLKIIAKARGKSTEDNDILRFQGQALQDAFAQFLRSHSYQAMRGEPKKTKEPDWYSPEAYGVATDRAIAEAYRQVAAEDRAETEGLLADEISKVQQAKETASRKLEQAVGLAQRILDVAADIGKETIDDAEENARRLKAETETQTAQMLAEAQAIFDRKVSEAERITAAAKIIEDIANARALEVARDTAALSEREADVAASAQSVDDKCIALDEQTARAARVTEEAEQLLATANNVSTELMMRKKAALDTETRNTIIAHQLALVGRALTDERLELVVADGPRGVSMNKHVMTRPEREVYLANWSDLAKSVARQAAIALATMKRFIVDSVEHLRSKLQADRSQLDADQATFATNIAAFAERRSVLDQQQLQARLFVEAWDHIPQSERSPNVQQSLKRAGGLLALAATIPKAIDANARAAGPRIPDSTGASNRDGNQR